MSPETKNCQNCKQDFTIEAEDFSFYQKIKVPPPTFCPECRQQRRMSWRNEKNFYKRECDLCKKKFVTIYSPDTFFNVYCHDCWKSDKWDGLDFGVSFDYEKSFFYQFFNLLKNVPLSSVDSKGEQVNSEYGNYNGNVKNCYLCTSTVDSENCMYCSNASKLYFCLDSNYLQDSDFCFMADYSLKNSNCLMIENTKESVQSSFLFQCSNLNKCFMTANQKNKSYYFRNKQYSMEEYNDLLSQIDTGSFLSLQKLKDEFFSLKLRTPVRYAEIKSSLDSTGNYIFNSKKIKNSFDVRDSENVAFSIRVLKNSKDIYDVHGIASGSLVYEGVGCGFYPNKNLFICNMDISQEINYSIMCRDSSHLFACIGLRNKSYCIFNKQYTKEEYQILVPKIIEHMNTMPYIDKKGRIYKYGEFFPSELSPFAYNETIAQEYFPLTKEEAKEQGYEWKEREERNYSIDLKNEDIPDNIKDTNDSIVGKVIECMHKECNHQCTEAFKIIPEEYKFYQRMNLPIPKLCPNCRHYERLAKRNPMKLWHRSCMCIKENHNHKDKCQNEFETSYAPDRQEIVYCEECYNREVY